ncbi:hypothetical protein EST38_g9438 [Candolleomyces aberdarensis]|uniref:BTB domain-containing protein n=1 Tax=Candolleomyces aberdarensis TaxID=2316362 RepID=A0A4Q2DC80_9AGAR|nr:hypothetical protein EST38_g9438 [Candolleomyces aberdarensis]
MTATEATTGPAMSTGIKDTIYYWSLVKFVVKDCEFRVPGYQFIEGSQYFSEKYNLNNTSNASAIDHVVVLEDVTAEDFRTFLKLLFPSHTKSATLTLTKAEWLTILALSTLWHFHELRKLAIEHLDPDMTDPVELVQMGRKAYVRNWVTRGYSNLVLKPEAISEEESEEIGYRSAVRLYIIRHALVQAGSESVNSRSTNAQQIFVETELQERFREEYAELGTMQKMHRTKEETQSEESGPREREEGPRKGKQTQKQGRKNKQKQDVANVQTHAEGQADIGETGANISDEQEADTEQLVRELEDCLEKHRKEEERREQEPRQEPTQKVGRKRAKAAKKGAEQGVQEQVKRGSTQLGATPTTSQLSRLFGAVEG